eukprot:CAMPEP_0203755064 /NCGR_PEP_ID=MMETSP0098-20131031/8581_1 /ASSEMBLY_ACC=CAM_ASM_000208 /TAXON_ID=96639 /ORGANISM=" , Strain NY0313808BC1" /LENGTH=175 /DNA_ID=CAMNT_0050646373 /DNA_START=210 /DNA_END=736 /DNA_ORIENTATION=-
MVGASFPSSLFYKLKGKLVEWWTGVPQPQAAPEGYECVNGVCKRKGDHGKFSAWESATDRVTPVKDESEWEELFEKTKSGKIMVVDFTATWCGPCKKISPFFSELCKEMNASGRNMKFVKVDVDDLDGVAADCKVSAMPTFQVYQNGALLEQVTGADEVALRSMVEKYCPNNAKN